MSLTLYYAPMSSAARIIWALEELGTPYEKVKLDLQAGDQKKPEYLKLNPNGKVPLLVVDGAPIFESLAILLHLGETYGASKGLFPAPGLARAEAFKWMTWGYVTLGDAVFRLARNTSDRFPADERNPKAADSARAELGRLFGILEQALEGRDYILGPSFSLSDIALAGFVGFVSRMGFDASPFTRTTAWAQRCTARPAFMKAMQA